MPRISPTLADIAADYALWGEYFDVDGHDTPETFERGSIVERLATLREYCGPERCPECERICDRSGGAVCGYCTGGE